MTTRVTIVRHPAVGAVMALLLLAGGAAQAADAKLSAMVPKEVRDRGTITVPSQINYPPYEFYDVDNKTPIGLDIEIMNAIGDTLGLPVQYVDTAVSAIIPSVQNGRYAIAISALFDRVSDEKQVDLIDYFVSGQKLLVRAGNPAHIADWSDLCGKRAMGTAGQPSLETLEEQSRKCVAGGKPAIDAQAAPGTSVRLAALKSGRVETVPVESAVAVYLARQHGADYETVGPIVARAPLGIVFKKGSLELEKAVQAALTLMKRNGTYAKILDKWGVGESGVKEFTIDGAAAFAP